MGAALNTAAAMEYGVLLVNPARHPHVKRADAHTK